MSDRVLPGHDDALIPWYALAWMDYEPRTWKSRVRSNIQQGMRPYPGISWANTWWDVWDEVKQDLARFAPSDPKEYLAHIRKLRSEDKQRAQRAALSGLRSFVHFCEISDEPDVLWTFKDFHCRALTHMRQTRLVCILLPFLHSKSWLSSVAVPLMDFAEDAEASQIRIYKSEDFTIGWARNLMNIVENHEPLHELFPHVSKPVRGDVAYKDWSTDRFSIKGKRNLLYPSWKPITWASRATGLRADRVGADDWVNDGNDDSVRVQEEMYSYFTSGVLTMGTFKESKSHYGTKWGTIFNVGTIFHKQDLNSRLSRAWRGKKSGHKVIRVDVYPRKNSEQQEEVIWPEKRPFWYVMEMKESLGERAFNMRMRNMAQGDDGTKHFDEQAVRNSVSEGLRFGDAPPAMPLIIGYDPATSKRTKYTKAPAYVVLGMGADKEVHFIEWGRWRGYSFPNQIGGLIDLANRYDCPIAVEDNQTQLSYAEQIQKDAPGIRIFTHSTQRNKRDPLQGVEQFIPLFRNGKIVIHGMNAPREELSALIREFVDWPQGEFTDLVMAAWIGKRQYDLHTSTRAEKGFFSTAPQFVQNRGLGSYIDLKALKERIR